MVKHFYRSPSGRLHRQLTCSGNGRPRVSKLVKLTQEQFEAEQNVCRCAHLVNWNRETR